RSPHGRRTSSLAAPPTQPVQRRRNHHLRHPSTFGTGGPEQPPGRAWPPTAPRLSAQVRRSVPMAGTSGSTRLGGTRSPAAPTKHTTCSYATGGPVRTSGSVWPATVPKPTATVSRQRSAPTAGTSRSHRGHRTWCLATPTTSRTSSCGAWLAAVASRSSDQSSLQRVDDCRWVASSADKLPSFATEHVETGREAGHGRGCSIAWLPDAHLLLPVAECSDFAVFQRSMGAFWSWSRPLAAIDLSGYSQSD